MDLHCTLIHCTDYEFSAAILLSFNVKCYLLFWDIYVLLIVSCVVTHEGRIKRGEGKVSPFLF